MHQGETIPNTLQKILDIMNGSEYILEKKFIYLLQGIQLEKLRALPVKDEDINYVQGYNDAADENNFAVQLAVEVIMGVHDDK